MCSDFIKYLIARTDSQHTFRALTYCTGSLLKTFSLTIKSILVQIFYEPLDGNNETLWGK